MLTFYIENKSLHLTIFDEYVFVIHTANIQHFSQVIIIISTETIFNKVPAGIFH